MLLDRQWEPWEGEETGKVTCSLLFLLNSGKSLYKWHSLFRDLNLRRERMLQVVFKSLALESGLMRSCFLDSRKIRNYDSANQVIASCGET